MELKQPIIKNSFWGKKIAVLGLGVEGLSSALWLKKQGAEVTVLERKRKEEIEKEVTKKLRNEVIKVIGGEDYLNNLSQFDVIVRSPGVRRNLRELVNAEKSGVLITSQTKIFFDLCPCPIIGVTGTKGKGTTCALIFEMLKKEGLDAYLGGNIGRPPFEFLDKLNPRSWAVLELSSFQLLDITKSPAWPAGRPHVAVVLMTTSEHLDYHKDTRDYVEAKRNILRFQTASDAAVINMDYPASKESDVETQGKVFWVSREDEPREGCFVKDGKIIVRVAQGHVTRKGAEVGYENFFVPQLSREKSQSLHQDIGARQDANRKNFVSSPRLSNNVVIEEVIHTSEILLPGAHNLENVCAAVMVATLCGVTKENIVGVLKTFKGLEHRLELVREVRGVRYYDDSFSTIPETAIAAIQAFKQPEILILGGSSKGSDFSELGRVIRDSKNIKAIIGIGKEWKRIKAQFRIQNLEFIIVEGCKDMKTIVTAVAKIAKKGDVVLLTPACASFDMFKNYKDRGEQFKKEVKKIL